MTDHDDEDHDDDSIAIFPRIGATLDHGRIVFEQRVRGRLWRGRTQHRSVLIVHNRIPYEQYRMEIDKLYRFDVPGIAPLEFLGFPDDGGAEIALAEALPEGSPISELEPLTASQVVQCGLDLCDAVLTWSERYESLIVGLRPETVYINGGRYTGSTPRIALLAGDPEGTTFGGPRYEAPNGSMQEGDANDTGFIVAQVMWFALLREHPYKFPGALNEHNNIWNDKRRPFTGPPELGRILEAVLVADPDRRLGVRGFRDQLAALR